MEGGHLDNEISKEHFALSRTGGVLRIEDLGSSNGTLIDGHSIAPRSPAPLHDGAVLRLGRSLFVFREALLGPLEPDRPVDGLSGPWGLRPVREALLGLSSARSKAVLVLGETGTGKELVAAAAAKALGRAGKSFCSVNVAALSPNTIEGHLFGWQRGAFSGAERTNPGLIRQADGGCVFLDEIGELPVDLQAKLLRVLENREVLPIGGHQPSKADVVFIAATHRDLATFAQEGRFRADLLARFRFRIEIPPLRKRPEDLLPLLATLWERQNEKANITPGKVDVEAMELVMLHAFPGNARDLERLVLSMPADRFELRLKTVERWLGEDGVARRPPPATLESVAAALARHDGNQSAAARELGVGRAVVVRMINDHPELRSIGATRNR